MRTKYVDLKVKSADLEEGIISGYASVFGNVDSYGDIVIHGAFSEFLEGISSSNKVIPIFYGHNMEDPKANIGGTIELREDSHGLFFKARLDLSGHTYGRVVYEQLKDGRLDSLSFGYRVLDAKMASEGYELRKLELYEISVVPVPANQEARITEVKARRSAPFETMDLIRRAYEALGELLDAVDPDSEETVKGIPVAEVMALLGMEENL